MDLTSLFSSLFSGQHRPYEESYSPYGPLQSQNTGDNTLLKFLMAQQPSTGQSLAGALPFLSLPGQQTNNLKPYENSIDAIGNTQNPMYQQVYQQQQEQGRQNLAQQITELSNQNRRLSSLGRTPLFDSERGGEQLFRGLTQGYQDVQNQAANNARSIIGTQAQGFGNIAAQKNQIGANQAGIQGNIFGGLAKLFGL